MAITRSGGDYGSPIVFFSDVTGQRYSSMSEAQAAEAAKTGTAPATPTFGVVPTAPPPAGPKLPAGFDPMKYIQANVDLRGMDADQATQHYLTHGFSENRKLAPVPRAPVRPAPAPVVRPATPAGPSPDLVAAKRQMAENQQAREALLAQKRAALASVQAPRYAKGGSVKSRGDGIARRGFTKGRMV